jgi:hypothetical protein
MDDFKPLSDPKLFHLFRDVLAQWTFLGADLCDPSVPSEGKFFEYMVRWDGPQPATLVMRCSPAAARIMAEAATGTDDVDDEVAADAFKELVNVVCGHLASAYWSRDPGRFAPFLPVPSSPEDWPHFTPTQRCVAAVEDQLIEILVWNEFPAMAQLRAFSLQGGQS